MPVFERYAFARIRVGLERAFSCGPLLGQEAKATLGHVDMTGASD